MEILLDKNFEKLWRLSKTDLINLTDGVIKKSSKLNNILSDINLNDQKNFNEFMNLLSDDIAEITIFHSIISFLQFISNDVEIRKTSYTADILLTNYQNSLNLNKKLYDKVVEYYKKADALNMLNDTDKRFLKKMVRTFRKNGIDLDDTNRDLLLKINHEISKIEIYMYRMFNTKKRSNVRLSVADIKGLPKSIVSMMEKENINGNLFYKFELNDIMYSQLMRYLSNGKIRRDLETHRNNQLANDIENMARLLVLRDKKANLLGYKNYSDYKSKYHMAKNSENIKDFLNEFIRKLDYRFGKEMETIKKIKKKDTGNKEISSWDVDYYIVKWKKKYGLDGQIVKQYFPVDHVIRTIFDIFQELFSIKFERIDGSYPWNENVVQYNVFDVKGSNKQLLGFLYLDLFKRNNKLKQTRSFVLRPRCQYPLNRNTIQPAVMSLISYIDNSLMDHSEVVNVFHEMGHIVYHMIGKTKYIPLSGSNIEKDFIHTPSLTLDNLCWDYNILKRLSKHHKTGKQLSDEIINKMINIRNLNVGIHYKKVVLSAIYDQFIHSSDGFIEMCENFLKIGDQTNKINTIKENFTNLYEQLHKKILKSSETRDVINFNKDTMFPYNFDTILVGDDALFYCIPWSKINSSDIYNCKFKDTKDLKKIGMEFRKHIFDNNGLLDSSEIIHNYLGRDLQIDGFLELYGLEKNNEYSFFFNTDKINSTTINNSPTTTEIILSENKNNIIEIDDEYDSELNRFSEIYDDELCTTEGIGLSKLQYLQNKIKFDDDTYMTENTESLKKYNNIFIKN